MFDPGPPLFEKLAMTYSLIVGTSGLYGVTGLAFPDAVLQWLLIGSRDNAIEVLPNDAVRSDPAD